MEEKSARAPTETRRYSPLICIFSPKNLLFLIFETMHLILRSNNKTNNDDFVKWFHIAVIVTAF
jgi:hypothetical protein